MLNGSELNDLKDALLMNGLLCHDYLLTGYIGRILFIALSLRLIMLH